MEMLDVKGAAARLGISLGQVRRLLASGQLPHYKIGRRVTLSDRDIDDFLSGHRVEAGPLKAAA